MEINENPGVGRSRHPNLEILSNIEFGRPPTSIFSFWSSAAEAAACECAAAGLSPAVNGVPDQSYRRANVMPCSGRKKTLSNAELCFAFFFQSLTFTP